MEWTPNIDGNRPPYDTLVNIVVDGHSKKHVRWYQAACFRTSKAWWWEAEGVSSAIPDERVTHWMQVHLP